MSTIRIAFDSGRAQAAVDALLELLGNRPEIAQAFVEFVDGLGDVSELVRFHQDDVPTAAGELRVSFEPTDALLDFLATARAGNVDGLVVQMDGHGPFLSGGGECGN